MGIFSHLIEFATSENESGKCIISPDLRNFWSIWEELISVVCMKNDKKSGTEKWYMVFEKVVQK